MSEQTRNTSSPDTDEWNHRAAAAEAPVLLNTAPGAVAGARTMRDRKPAESHAADSTVPPGLAAEEPQAHARQRGSGPIEEPEHVRQCLGPENRPLLAPRNGGA